MITLVETLICLLQEHQQLDCSRWSHITDYEFLSLADTLAVADETTCLRRQLEFESKCGSNKEVWGGGG